MFPFTQCSLAPDDELSMFPNYFNRQVHLLLHHLDHKSYLYSHVSLTISSNMEIKIPDPPLEDQHYYRDYQRYPSHRID